MGAPGVTTRKADVALVDVAPGTSSLLDRVALALALGLVVGRSIRPNDAMRG